MLDVGCGTGLCLPLLHEKVGPGGTIVGIDASEQMLRVAADRVAAHGWDNVRLLAAPAQQVKRGSIWRRLAGLSGVIEAARNAFANRHTSVTCTYTF